MYEASNPLFQEAVFYLVWGFLWKLGYMCRVFFFNLALFEIDSCSVQVLEALVLWVFQLIEETFLTS